MRRPTLRVLTYHRVTEPGTSAVPRPASVSARPLEFERQMCHVARHYRVVTANEVMRAWRGEQELPQRAVLITFDDAYRDVGEVAWPILRRLGLPALLFVPTAFPGDPGREFWWERLHRVVGRSNARVLHVDGLRPLTLRTERERIRALATLERRVRALPHATAMRLVETVCDRLDAGGGIRVPVLAWNELRALASDGLTLAPHTRTHPALTRLAEAQVREEVRGACADLAREVGCYAPILAYPFGDHDDVTVCAARAEGIELALTCVDGHSDVPSTDPLRLRRTNITLRTTGVLFRARLTRMAARVDAWRHRRPTGSDRHRDEGCDDGRELAPRAAGIGVPRA